MHHACSMVMATLRIMLGKQLSFSFIFIFIVCGSNTAHLRSIPAAERGRKSKSLPLLGQCNAGQEEEWDVKKSTVRGEFGGDTR